MIIVLNILFYSIDLGAGGVGLKDICYSSIMFTLIWSGRIVLSRPAQPCPVSPRPCRNTIEAVCLIRGFRITGRKDILHLEAEAV